MSYTIALAIIAATAFVVVAALVWCVTKARTRWLIERMFWVLFGVLFGVTMLLSILSIYGEQ